ncbi:putative uncharacterized protein [Rhodococcus sp. AW25M09]|uniref:YciI family protein n=1 Tax=Rhodococcus sp. AW25M09 TaxID=1268303 RepID=UPI0002AC084A|nr:YciI family protein [Rhodococcus sp. AW25M09]CCQ18089.1 putative uncharacterized protein [Rhodococcus sp. AW25M09]
MKYMLLTYGSQQEYDALAGQGSAQARSAEELAEMGSFLEKFTGDLAGTGELVQAAGLTAPALASRVQLRDGVSVVTDGPFAETEEVLAGYWIVDCSSMDRALEIAARLNECPGPVPESGTVVRAIEGFADDIGA